MSLAVWTHIYSCIRKTFLALSSLSSFLMGQHFLALGKYPMLGPTSLSTSHHSLTPQSIPHLLHRQWTSTVSDYSTHSSAWSRVVNLWRRGSFLQDRLAWFPQQTTVFFLQLQTGAQVFCMYWWHTYSTLLMWTQLQRSTGLENFFFCHLQNSLLGFHTRDLVRDNHC